MFTTNSWGNISIGKFYTFSASPSLDYPDRWGNEFTHGTILTNGLAGTDWPLKHAWVGWHSTAVNIDVDLGSIRAISHVKMNAASRGEYAISYPASMTVFTSSDGQSWTIYGSPRSFPTNPANGAWETATVAGNGAWVNARFVRISLPSTPGHYVFIDQVIVEGTIIDSRKLIPEGHVYHGAFPSDAAGNLQIGAFETVARRSLKIVLWYADWSASFEANISRVIDELLQERFLEVGWLPSYATSDEIAAGKYDDFLKKWLQACGRKNYPMWLRPLNEMNGPWTYPSSDGHLKYGGDPQTFRWAWRRLYNIAERVGAVGSNQIFLWSPDANAGGMSDYYPGHQYVDWVGVSAYSQKADQSLDAMLDEVDELYGAHKPLMLSESGAGEGVGTAKAEWIRAWFQTIQYRRPHFKACVWFHSGEYRIDTSPEAIEAYRPYFRGN